MKAVTEAAEVAAATGAMGKRSNGGNRSSGGGDRINGHMSGDGQQQ